MLDKNQQYKTNIAQLEQSINQGRQENELLQLTANTKLSKSSEQRSQLEKKLKQLDEQLISTASGFIPAKLMPLVLEQMLEGHSGLELVSLKNIAPVTVSGEESSSSKNDSEDGSTLYQHGVSLELKGSYHNALGYLENLEALKWHFHWQALRYEVAEYPLGTLMLEVFTYSTDKEWLGV